MIDHGQKLLLVAYLGLFVSLSAADNDTIPTGLDARVGKEWVQIYGDFVEVPQNFGYSPYRALIHNVSLELMQKSNSLWIANDEGWLTAVVLRRKLAEKLKQQQLSISRYIQDLGGVYRLQYQGIDIQFSLEPAPAEMLSLIDKVYQNQPTDAEVVIEHYRRNYVIRIYRVENVFNSKQQDSDFAEALIAATLIGDSYQMFWGMHDGYDLLEKIQE